MNTKERDLKVMQTVTKKKVSPRKLMSFQKIFTQTVKANTTMKLFKKMNKNRRFAIQVELFTKEFLASEALLEDEKVFSDKLQELIVNKRSKDLNKRGGKNLW